VETVAHFATCAAKRRERKTTPAASSVPSEHALPPSPPDALPAPAPPEPTVTDLQCQALEALLESFGMVHRDWTCALCGLGDDECRAPSHDNPALCGVCAGEECRRCGNAFEGEMMSVPGIQGYARGVPTNGTTITNGILVCAVPQETAMIRSPPRRACTPRTRRDRHPALHPRDAHHRR
jgi:hypothetical protein